MLRYLRVRNFALIDQLELHFDGGFNLLSGETGAGKSIVVDALALLAGGKASADAIRSGESRATVEAIFDSDIGEELERLGLEAEGSEVLVKREIASDGRNRAYINNQPATVAALRELAPALIDIHGQHEQQTLMDPANQLRLVDAFAGTLDMAAKVRDLARDLQKTEAELQELQAAAARRVERMDLLSFQRDEIRKANPKAGETEAARERVTVLSHAGKLLDAAQRNYEALYESEASVASVLGQAQRSLREAAQHDKRLADLADQTETARIQIQEIASGLRGYAERMETDPQELEHLQSRLAELERLQRKYGPDLLAHLDRVNAEMDSMGLAETKKEELENRRAALGEQYQKAAASLSRKRRSASRKLEDLVAAELQTLAMPDARFEVRWTDIAPGRGQGIDQAEFLISANPGEEPRPLGRIASGGELSRVMLALRTILVLDDAAGTLVFDEVDAGIGGKAAETVGRKLQELSRRYQVLCVTHLAQIAACADHHFRIEKLVLDGRTVTRVEALAGDARVEELARMMIGSRVTDAARKHIREILAGNHPV